MNRAIVAALIVTGVFAIGAVPIARAQTVPAGLQACKAETDDARRLACFDREIARLSQTQPQTADNPPPAPSAPQLSAEERFGRRAEIVREERERQSAQTPALKELSAVVTGISSRGYGELMITLDNGQVWIQVAADPHFSLSVADKVTIKPASFGSFILSAPSGRGTRVKRLR